MKRNCFNINHNASYVATEMTLLFQKSNIVPCQLVTVTEDSYRNITLAQLQKNCKTHQKLCKVKHAVFYS